MIKAIGDIISGVQARSTASVKFTVAAVPATGLYALYRNGVLLYSFQLVTHPPSGGQQTAFSGTGTDANPTGAMLRLFSADGVSSRTDAQQFINSLK